MKFTIIHNIYHDNPYVAQTIELNLLALNSAKINYQYIVFNDAGDFPIQKIMTLINSDEIKYFKSKINYGKKKCTGGWLGAEKENLIEGEIVHNIGQDDVMTGFLYEKAKECFGDSNNWFFTSNAFKANEKLEAMEIMINPAYEIDYQEPYKVFASWFGIKDGEVTRANNGMLASGTMYRRQLHDLIGLPDLDNFEGAADFEYWARILWNGYKGKYLSMPSWYYRQSEHSAGNEIIDGKPNRGHWQQLAIERIKELYSTYVLETTVNN